LLIEQKWLLSQQLSSKVVFHTKDEFPDLDKVKIVQLDNRGNNLAVSSYGLIYRQFERVVFIISRKLQQHTIADLGDIFTWKFIDDTYFAVKK
jgi:hypothetical protein